jgi:two-component system, LuxR family, response regulator FixJ
MPSVKLPSSSKKSSGNVFLIEDDEELRADLERMLGFYGYQVRSFPNPKEYLAFNSQVAPAVVVTDMRMPEMSGVELQAELLRQGRKIPIIFISGQSEDHQIVKALKTGAVDFILKPFAREELLVAVAKGLEIDTLEMFELIRRNELEVKLKSLSPRERQVFELLVKGHNNKEIMEALGISLPTTKQYKSEVMYKLRVRSLAELMSINASLA